MRKNTGFKSFFMVLAATSALVCMLGITAFAATEPAKTTTTTPSATVTPAVTTPSATATPSVTTTPSVVTTPSAVVVPTTTTPSATLIGAAETKGTVKKIETIEKQVFVTLNDSKADHVYYTDAASESGKVVLQLKEGAVVTIKYATGTPVKYHDTMATPINNVANAVTPEVAATPAPVKPVTAPTGISVMVNGSAVTFDVKPQIIKDSTMVPVRAILEKMGYALTFDAKTGVIKATEGKNEITMTIGSPVVKMGEKTYDAPVAPMIIDGRTLIPLRALGEISGYAVKWDEATQTASLTK